MKYRVMLSGFVFLLTTCGHAPLIRQGCETIQLCAAANCAEVSCWMPTPNVERCFNSPEECSSDVEATRKPWKVE